LDGHFGWFVVDFWVVSKGVSGRKRCIRDRTNRNDQPLQARSRNLELLRAMLGDVARCSHDALMQGSRFSANLEVGEIWTSVFRYVLLERAERRISSNNTTVSTQSFNYTRSLYKIDD
jgi:hypothetical protein